LSIGLSVADEATGNIIYTFPSQGAHYILPECTIILRFDEFPDIPVTNNSEFITVNGIIQKSCPGELLLLPERNSVIFKPSKPFETGDTITVSINQDLLGTNIGRFTFYICDTQPEQETEDNRGNRNSVSQAKTLKSGSQHTLYSKSDVSSSVPRLINGIAVPADFPAFFPTINEETAPGYLFLQNWLGAPYIMILHNDGTPYFYRKVEDRSRDFKLQPTGVLSRLVRPGGLHYQLMDEHYQPIRDIYAQNGYDTDEHELTLTDDGNAFVIANDYHTVDMSAIVTGGNPNATVIGNNVQEIDEDNNVVFQWNCWDHFNIADAVHEDLTNNTVDFVHMNSIAVDYDGNILISSRHLSECTKIDRITGDIIWRFGGENNQFTLINDVDGISYQHDLRPVKGHPGHYTIFDNGNYKSPTYSRAVEFVLDTVAMTAEKVWEYIYPDGATHWMGNVERLPNGNTYINWADGALPKATEVTPAGEVVYQGDFEIYTHSYRTFRFEWEGSLLQPELILEPYPDQLTLIFNKFGDTLVKGYNIYAGKTSNPASLIASTQNNYYNFTDELDNNSTYYFRVKAYYEDDSESAPSDIESTYIDLIQPGENLITNGDFSDGASGWDLVVDPSASATGTVNESQQYYFDITGEGSEYYHVQLLQDNIPLIEGKDYIFEFDAIADVPRTVEIKVEQAVDPWNNYSQTGLSYIEETLQHYRYDFTMDYATDFDSRVVVNCGGVAGNFAVDNFSLREDVDINPVKDFIPVDNSANGQANVYFRNQSLIIDLAAPVYSKIQFKLFDINGNLIEDKTIVSGANDIPGYKIDFTGYSEGIYLLQIISNDIHNNTQIQTIKIPHI
jgi:hypothetical protein